MVSLRLSVLSFVIVVGLFISCSKTTTQNNPRESTVKPPKELKNNVSTIEEVTIKEEKKESSKQKKTDHIKLQEVDLVPEIEKNLPGNEKVKNVKQRAVNREVGNNLKVLEILLPDKKKVDETKVLTTAKKSSTPLFEPCDVSDIPIIRLTNTRYIDEKYPTISNDGGLLVYEGWHRVESGENTSQALYCTQLDATLRKTVLVKNGFNNVRPFIHPSLKEVYFSTDVYKDEFHVASVVLDGSGATNLNFRKICRDVLDISISSKLDYAICYFKEGKSTPSIGMINNSGFFYPEIAEGKEVAWSQSGDRIVFVNTNGAYLDVYSSKQDGSDLLQVTTHFGICHHPSFSPDDQWVVFSAVTDATKKFDLFIARKDGKNLIQITNAIESDRNPFWGKDGWIYFETDRFDGNSEIAKIDSSFFIKKFEEQVTPPVFLK